MTNTLFFFIFIPLLAFILLAINLIFAPHNPYQEKKSAFECGFHSFLGQNRTQFSISFFIFALLFLLFDLEILLVYPYIVSGYANGIYGLIVMLIFFLVLTLGFAFELGKNALKIDSRQMYSVWYKGTNILEFNSQKNTFLFYTLKGNVIIKAFYHYYACFNLHFYCKLMLKSTIFKVIFLVISIFCLYILKMDSFSFNTLLLVSLFIFYTYRIYCKAKFNLNLWIYFTVLLLLSLSVLAISWQIIAILLMGVSGFLPSFIVWLSLLPDPANFLENYLVLTEPSGSNNFYGSQGEGSGGSGNGGSTDPGRNTGPNGGSDIGNPGFSSEGEKEEDRMKRWYSVHHTEAGTRAHISEDGIFCSHYGQMYRVDAVDQDPDDPGENVNCRGGHKTPLYFPPGEAEPGDISKPGGWHCGTCAYTICDGCVKADIRLYAKIQSGITKV